MIRIFFRAHTALILAALVAACGSNEAAETAARPVLTVELVSPSREDWPQRLAASGEVAAWQEASIGAEVGGLRLDKVLVNVGDTVRKNQLLARFSEESLRVELARLDAAVAEAQANLGKAQADAERAALLDATGSLSQQEILLYRTQAATAAAQLASANAQREAQALKLRYAQVLAPDDGVISSRTATVGAVIASGSELFRLIRRNRLEWRAEVRSDALTTLQPGMPVTLHRLDGSPLAGRLRQVAPTVDRGTRNGLVYVDLPGNSGVAAGMYLSGEFELPGSTVLAVPESAVVLRDGNRYLMKVDADGRVHEIKVATGRRRQSAVEILGGIEPGEHFVRSGGAFVNDGDQVRIAEATGTTGTAGAAP